MKLSLSALVVAACLIIASFAPAMAARYYEEQNDFIENRIPVANYRWDHDDIEGCIYKEDSVKNSYYVWTKIGVQKWRQALREYTGDEDAWNFTARYVSSQAELESCDVKFYIYGSYKDFPGYPNQTGAYTSADPREGLDVRVYLAPLVLHGDGKTEIDLPSYAFRNSAVHEVGHVLGLGHMQSQKGYLMSPQFDFWEEDDQLPITTLELNALMEEYGSDGFG